MKEEFALLQKKGSDIEETEVRHALHVCLVTDVTTLVSVVFSCYKLGWFQDLKMIGSQTLQLDVSVWT